MAGLAETCQISFRIDVAGTGFPELPQGGGGLSHGLLDGLSFSVLGYEPLAPLPPAASAVPVWQDRTIASAKLRLLEYSAFMEVPRDAETVTLWGALGVLTPHPALPNRLTGMGIPESRGGISAVPMLLSTKHRCPGTGLVSPRAVPPMPLCSRGEWRMILGIAWVPVIS